MAAEAINFAKYRSIVAARDRLQALYRIAADRQRSALGEGVRLRSRLADVVAYRGQRERIDVDLAGTILLRRGAPLAATTKDELNAAGFDAGQVASIREADRAAADAAVECRDISAQLSRHVRLVDHLTEYVRRVAPGALV